MRPTLWKRLGIGAAVLFFLSALGVSAVALPAARAQGPSGSPRDKFLQGGTITIPAGETVNHDLYVTGGTVRIDGRVDGDLFVAGGTVTVTGPVSGNLFVAGGTVVLSGQVVGDLFVAGGNISSAASVGRHLRAVGGNIAVSGPVALDLLAAGGTLDVVPPARVGGDLIFGTGSTTLGAPVDGGVLGSAQTYKRNGSVGGSEDVTLRQRRPQESPTALSRLLDQIRRYISILVIGLLLLWLLPRLLDATARQLRARPGVSLGVGLLTVACYVAGAFGVAVATGILAIILGILGFGQLLLMAVLGVFLGAGAISYLLLLILLFVAAAVTGLVLGRLILGQVAAPWAAAPYVALLLGVLIIVVLTALPIVGAVVDAVVVLLGLGALVLVLWRRGQPPAGRLTQSTAPAV